MSFRKALTFSLLIIFFFSTLSVFPSREAYALSVPNVTVTPNVIAQYGNYTIAFTTGSTLLKDSDKITITFPLGTVLPCGCGGVSWKASDFSVNGLVVNTMPAAISADNSIIITVPLTIAGGSAVEVKIKSSALIKNPPNIRDDYTITISTTREITPVQSSPYYIGYSRISTPEVFVSPSVAKSQSDIVINFKTGVLGALLKGSEKIYVEFPKEFTIPLSVSSNSVFVNGVRVSESDGYPYVVGNTISFPLPVSIQADSNVRVEFNSRSGIVNPEVSNNYNLKVWTSKETTPVTSSDFIITPEPGVKTNVIILPQEVPDGKNDYYLHPITVVLIGYSNVGAKVTVHFSVDGGDWQSASGQPVQLQFNDGDHKINFYSEDENGIKEEARENEFAIDTTVPEIELTDPTGDFITSSYSYLFRGKVINLDNTTTLKINGNIVSTNNKGEFSQSLDLKEGDNVVTLVAEDAAGNLSEVKIKITVSTAVPKLIIASPKDWQEVREDAVTVTGQVDIDSDLTVNGNPVSLNEDRTFSFDLLLNDAPKGFVPVKIIATAKESGLSTIRTILVMYNPKPKGIIIKLTIGENSALVNEENMAIDSPPYIDSLTGRTLVPLRFISEAFSADVQWDAVTRSVTVLLNGRELKLQIDNSEALVDGQVVSLDQPPVIQNNRTMVPIRFIAENLGADVDWDSTTKTITITYKL